MPCCVCYPEYSFQIDPANSLKESAITAEGYSMELDLVQTTLAILLGASVANVLDERFQFVPRLADWLSNLWN